MLSDDYKTRCEELIESAIRYSQKNLKSFNKNVDIDYSVINTLEFNANSKLCEEKYAINIHSEVFERIYDILKVLFYKENITFYKSVSWDEEYCEEKAFKYLGLLMELSTKLIINHELGHILNGHLRYKKSLNIVNDKNECYMFMDSEKNELDPIESQVLEMDADAYAATCGIGAITYDENINNYNKITPNFIKNKSHAVILLVIASTIVFSIQGLGKKKENSNLEDLKYLPLRTRQDYYMRCILNAYKNMNLKEKLDFDIDFLREVLPNIEEYVNLYNQQVLGFHSDDYNSKNNIEELGQVYLKHCDYLDRFWTKTMRDKLLPYSYLSLFP
ncbi:hypothetical protein [Clostridium cellulovorans]|uniref:Uncharacterized protein n=1 Tax=Clostridium cellulovorans (strain ATCC 35296 / DSM 3052 / OCM 3 / 743B) TaxID=573061 RepID=D9SSF2_CLOC7|nr:hypothetical protein [Clostridium cellulovorans]ADL50549.1 hypothetical protein Clocel_0779 [Clostridium cellulovorans 743B]